MPKLQKYKSITHGNSRKLSYVSYEYQKLNRGRRDGTCPRSRVPDKAYARESRDEEQRKGIFTRDMKSRSNQAVVGY